MKRIIERIPFQNTDGNTRQGRTEPQTNNEQDECFIEKLWYGPTTENVVKQMNDTLGEVDDSDYDVRE